MREGCRLVRERRSCGGCVPLEVRQFGPGCALACAHDGGVMLMGRVVDIGVGARRARRGVDERPLRRSTTVWRWCRAQATTGSRLRTGVDGGTGVCAAAVFEQDAYPREAFEQAFRLREGRHAGERIGWQRRGCSERHAVDHRRHDAGERGLTRDFLRDEDRQELHPTGEHGRVERVGMTAVLRGEPRLVRSR